MINDSAEGHWIVQSDQFNIVLWKQLSFVYLDPFLAWFWNFLGNSLDWGDLSKSLIIDVLLNLS